MTLVALTAVPVCDNNQANFRHAEYHEAIKVDVNISRWLDLYQTKRAATVYNKCTFVDSALSLLLKVMNVMAN